MIEFFGNPEGDYMIACIEAASICVCTMVITVMGYMSDLLAVRVGMKMRVASNCLIYKKVFPMSAKVKSSLTDYNFHLQSLKLSKTGIGKTKIAEIEK